MNRITIIRTASRLLAGRAAEAPMGRTATADPEGDKTIYGRVRTGDEPVG